MKADDHRQLGVLQRLQSQSPAKSRRSGMFLSPPPPFPSLPPFPCLQFNGYVQPQEQAPLFCGLSLGPTSMANAPRNAAEMCALYMHKITSLSSFKNM